MAKDSAATEYRYEQDYFDSAHWGGAPDYLREVVADILAVLPEDATRILDVGCGDGFITDRLPADRDVIGVDLSPVALAHVKRPTQIADATALPFADRSFDLVMANDIIEHFEASPRAKALAEIGRVAARYVIITTPFAEWLARGQLLVDGLRQHVNRHCHSFDLDMMKSLVPSFRLVRAVFSGVEWEDETHPVEELRRRIREEGTTPALEAALSDARREQAQLLCEMPERIDGYQRRTEIMALYMRSEGDDVATWPRAWAKETALDYNAALATGSQLDRLSLAGSRFEALQRSDLPTVSPAPYACPEQGVTLAQEGASLIPGSALRFGFFAPLEPDAVLALSFAGLAAPATARVLVHEKGDYRILAELKLPAGDNTLSTPLEMILPSEYGYLFHVSVDAPACLKAAVIIQQRTSASRAAPGEARYLVRQAGDIEIATSLRGPERRIPDWFAQAEHYPAREGALDQPPRTLKQLLFSFSEAQANQRRLEARAARDRWATAALKARLQEISASALPQGSAPIAWAEERNAAMAAHESRMQQMSAAVEAQALETVAVVEKRLQNLGEALDTQAGILSNCELAAARLTFKLKTITDRLDTLEQSTFHLRKVMDRTRLFLRPMVHGLRNLSRRRGPPILVPTPELPAPLETPANLEPLGSSPAELAPVPRASPRYGELPRTVTMIVPDDRIDRRVLLEARTLTQAGAKVLVVAAPYPEPIDLDRLQFPEVDIIRIDTMRPPEFRRDVSQTRLGRFDFNWEEVYFYTHQFLNAALTRPAELVVAHDLPVLPAAIAAADMMGARIIYDAHELYPEQQYFGPERIELYRRAEKALASLPDGVLTVNKSIAEEMALRYDIPEPTVLINAPDASTLTLPLPRTSKLRETFGFGDNIKLFLYQGGLSLNRNLEALAVSLAYVRDPNVVLVFMGPGDEKRRELEALASERDLLGKRVFFHPAVPQDVLLSYTSSADVGIIPYPGIDVNTTLCTPNKMFEFLVAGLPILANDLPELRRYVVDQGAGIAHAMTSPQAIAAGIDRMAEMDLARYRSGAQAAAPRMVWAAQEPIFLDACLRSMAPR